MIFVYATRPWFQRKVADIYCFRHAGIKEIDPAIDSEMLREQNFSVQKWTKRGAEAIRMAENFNPPLMSTALRNNIAITGLTLEGEAFANPTNLIERLSQDYPTFKWIFIAVTTGSIGGILIAVKGSVLALVEWIIRAVNVTWNL